MEDVTSNNLSDFQQTKSYKFLNLSIAMMNEKSTSYNLNFLLVFKNLHNINIFLNYPMLFKDNLLKSSLYSLIYLQMKYTGIKSH